MKKQRNFKEKGITLVALVITIIIILILAVVAINVIIGENGLVNRTSDATEKYEIENIRETVEMGIVETEIEAIKTKEEATIEVVLQELVEKGIFESIDKEANIGYIGEYEVKLKYNEQGKVVIEYIHKATGIRATYTLNPVGYTNKEKVNILLKVQGKVKSVTKLDNSIIYAENGVVEINEEVTANGTYTFIIEDEEGNKQEKNVIVDTIDRLAPKDFTPEIQIKGSNITIIENGEDAETDGINVKSGIEKYEYYIKLSTVEEYTKYDTGIIDGLEIGKYNMYIIAYDKAGNKKECNIVDFEIIMQFESVISETTHTLAMDTNGNLYGWGYGDSRVLASSNPYVYRPLKIKENAKFKQIKTESWHAIAIDEEGKLWVWGHVGYQGALGNQYYPAQIKEGTKFTQIEAGESAGYAIDEQGNLWAWGYNHRGQLGDGTTTDRTTPVPIAQETKFIKIENEYYASYAIDTEGNLWAWGYNYKGQLGDESTTDKTAPVQIKEGVKFVQIKVRNHSVLAIDTEGNLWAWGLNDKGQLGDGTTINKNTPTKIKEGTKFTQIDKGNYASYAIDTEGNLWAWGYNDKGQLGDETTTDKTVPVQIKKETKFAQIKAGPNSVLAIDSEGELWTWGNNYNGQLGDGTTIDKNTPIKIKEGTKFIQIEMTNYTVFAIDENKNLWGWGANNYAQVGNGSENKVLIPVQIR